MENKSKIVPVLLYGSIIGVVSVVLSLIMQITNSTFSTPAMILGYVVPFAAYFYALYAYRSEYKGGYMSYSHGVGMGALFSIVSSLIAVIYFIVLVNYISPDYPDQITAMAEEKMLKKGLDEDAIEQAMQMSKAFRSVAFMSVSAFFGGIIMGTVYSLIVMAFLKKEPKDPFAEVIGS